MHKFEVALTVALVLSPALFAQESTQSTAPVPPKHHQMRGDWADQRLKRLSKRLNLTDDQKEKLKPILQDEANQTKSVEEDSALTPQQKHKKIRDIRMASRSQMDGILTDEQKKQLPSPRTHGGGAHHGRHSQTSQPSTTSPDSGTPQ